MFVLIITMPYSCVFYMSHHFSTKEVLNICRHIPFQKVIFKARNKCNKNSVKDAPKDKKKKECTAAVDKPCDQKISDGTEKITEERNASANERQKGRNNELEAESGEEKTQELYETEEGTATGSEVGEKQDVVGGNKDSKGNPQNENQHEEEVKECSVKTQVEMSHDASPVDHQTAHGSDDVDEPSPARDDVSADQD